MMEVSENKSMSPLKIGVVGAGFSGVALIAALHRQSTRPIQIFLFEKRGRFGAGDAYSTPFPFHLLNVRAQEMSALEEESEHFVNWLCSHSEAAAYLDHSMSFNGQFVPRFLYGTYLNHLLHTIQADKKSQISLTLESVEVIDIMTHEQQATLFLQDQRNIQVDKVILALGNNPPATLPFPVAPELPCFHSWDYAAPTRIKKTDPVLIVGTGLSMIDAVLTLYHQQHQGKIYAISRHGLLPLPHAELKTTYALAHEQVPKKLRSLTKYLRSQSKSHHHLGGDWRSVINALRASLPNIWAEASVADKRKFLRHVLPYWNIHRHRVNGKMLEVLKELCATQQLEILSGRVLSIADNKATIQSRSQSTTQQLPIRWLINCMGPALNMAHSQITLVQSLLARGAVSLDSLGLGFAVSATGALKDATGADSSLLYTLGPPARGAVWECSAVPEIRKQCLQLATHLLRTK